MTLSAAQLALRRNGIGSSDIAAIVGLSFWGDGQHNVYLAKRYGIKQTSSLATRAGDAMERAIEPEYEHETGVRLAPLLDAYGDPLTLVHPEIPWAMASIDRVRVTDWIPVEIKLVMGERAHYHRGEPEVCDWCGRPVNLHWGREPGAVPDDVAAQVQWQMIVSGAPWAHVCRFWAARGGPEFKIHTVRHNQEIADYLLCEGERFWHSHVLPGVPPDPDASDYSEQCERRNAQNVLNKVIAAPQSAESIVNDFLDGERMIRAGREKLALAANRLRRLIGPYDGIQGQDFKVTNRVRSDGARSLRVSGERRKRVIGNRDETAE